jgi:hypothetical protein
MACKLSKSPDTTAYTQLEVKWPMDEATIASPDTISPDTLAKIFQSEDPTKPGGG